MNAEEDEMRRVQEAEDVSSVDTAWGEESRRREKKV